MFGRKKKQKQDLDEGIQEIQNVQGGEIPKDDLLVHTMQGDLAANAQATASGPNDTPPANTAEESLEANTSNNVENSRDVEVSPFAQQDLSLQSAPFPQQEAVVSVEGKSPFGGSNTGDAPQNLPTTPQPQPQSAPTQPQMQQAQQAQPSMDFSKSAPFGTGAQSADASTDNVVDSQDFAQASIEEEISKVQQENVLTADDSDTPKKSRIVQILLFGILGIVIVAIITAGYYFFQSRESSEKMAADTPVTINDAPVDETEGDIMTENGIDELPQTPPVVVVTPDEYSERLPNYIFLTVEGDTVADTNAKLREIDQAIQTQRNGVPIVFTVTDESNSPIALQRYNDLTDLNLPVEVLSVVDELFLLYAYYDDNGETHFGLSAKMTDIDTAHNALRAAEAALPSALTHLFNGVAPTVTEAVFSDSTHGEYAIRYANLTESENLSVDYAFIGEQLIIGTSKDTLRAIIDRQEGDRKMIETDSTPEGDLEIISDVDAMGKVEDATE